MYPDCSDLVIDPEKKKTNTQKKHKDSISLWNFAYIWLMHVICLVSWSKSNLEFNRVFANNCTIAATLNKWYNQWTSNCISISAVLIVLGFLHIVTCLCSWADMFSLQHWWMNMCAQPFSFTSRTVKWDFLNLYRVDHDISVTDVNSCKCS